MKIARIEDFNSFYDECIKLINDENYDKYYRTMSLSILLKDAMPIFSQKRREAKEETQQKKNEDEMSVDINQLM